MKDGAIRTIGVFSPAGAVDPGLLQCGVEAFRREGFRVVVSPHAADRKGYLSASDEERFSDLETLWSDPEIDLLLASRGGFGCARLLERIAALPSSEKFVGGFSDLTALLWALDRAGKGRPVAMPMAAKFYLYDPASRENAWRALRGETRRAGNLAVLKEGDFAGRALPGNLAVAASLAGTPYFPDCRGRVLILEEVNEPLYKIDRMLTQLDQCGAFRACAGVVFGEFSGENYPDGELEDLLRRACRNVPGGVRAKLRYGHEEGDFFSIGFGETVSVHGATLSAGSPNR